MVHAPSPFRRRAAAAAAGLALLAGASAAFAQPAPAAAASAPADKTVVVDAPFTAFTRWVAQFASAAVDAVMPGAPQGLPLAAQGAAQAAAYEPVPVILGLPELPLVGADAAAAARAWGPQLNYQGLHARLVVVDVGGTRRSVRSLAAPLRAGERFKVRLTSTFDAVADTALIVGGPWSSQRGGQVYPAAGMSVEMKAGETVELPLDERQYFVMGPAGNRLLLSVRHAKALGDARSGQPAYRQDTTGGSSYLQLVPRGKYPAVEQLISSR